MRSTPLGAFLHDVELLLAAALPRLVRRARQAVGAVAPRPRRPLAPAAARPATSPARSA